MSIDQSILDKFEAVVESQLARIADMKAQDDFIDYTKLDKLIICLLYTSISPMLRYHPTAAGRESAAR